MSGPRDLSIRRAGPADVESIGRLLHDFNREFDEPTPGPEALADRMRQLLAGGGGCVETGMRVTLGCGGCAGSPPAELTAPARRST